MDDRILEFIGDLRRSELRVSTTEALDALQAAQEVGLADRDDFRHALAATLVKETRDLPTFERIFDLYFFDLKALGAETAKALGREDPWARALLERLLAGRRRSTWTRWRRCCSWPTPPRWSWPIRQGGRGVGLERLFYFLQVGYFTRRIWDQFPWQEIEARSRGPPGAGRGGGDGPGRPRPAPHLHGAPARGVPAARSGSTSSGSSAAGAPARPSACGATSSPRSRSSRCRPTRSPRCRRWSPGSPGGSRTPSPSGSGARSRASSTRKRTLRASLQYGGVPVELRWRRRHRDKPRLVTLCDVSDSVRNASRFMLQLVWNLQECFSKVQSFAFVSEIAEVSESFRSAAPRARRRVRPGHAPGRLPQPLGLRLRLRPLHAGSRSIGWTGRRRSSSWATRGTTTTTRRPGRSGSCASA